MLARGSGHAFSNTTTGGQSWTKDCETGIGSPGLGQFHAIYNGTWAANPAFRVDDLTASVLSIVMEIYTPTSGSTFSNTPDVACTAGYAAAGATFTITGQTPSASASVVTVAFWGVAGAESFGSLTGGWTTRGSDASITNLQGSDITGSVADKIQSSASATGDVAETIGETNQAVTSIVTFKETASVTGFTAGPTYSKVDNNTIRATFTCSSGTPVAKGGLYVLGATAPTGAQIAAGTNAHGTASTMCTGSSQTLDIDASDSPAFPGYDPYVILDSSGSYSSVPTTTHTCLDAPSNFQYVACPSGLTSIGTGSVPEAYNDASFQTIPYGSQTVNFTVGRIVRGLTSDAWAIILADSDSGVTGTLTLDKRSGTFQSGEVLADASGGLATSTGTATAATPIATTDILESPTTVSPASAALTVGTDGQYSYTGSGRQSALNGLVYHRSTAAYLPIDLDAWFNNQGPACSGGVAGVTLSIGVAIVPFDINTRCNDPEGDTISCGVTAGTLPSGISLNPATCVLSGTPTVEGSGAAVDVTVLDLALEISVSQFLFNVTITHPAPDCVAVATLLADCESDYQLLFDNTINFAETQICSNSVASGYVIATSPKGGTEIPVNANVGITYSKGACAAHPVAMVNCIAKSTTQCQTLVTDAFGTDVTFSASSALSCPAGFSSGQIYSQSPTQGRPVTPPAILRVSYCP